MQVGHRTLDSSDLQLLLIIMLATPSPTISVLSYLAFRWQREQNIINLLPDQHGNPKPFPPSPSPLPVLCAETVLACTTWLLLVMLLAAELQGRYVLELRTACVRVTIVLVTSSELAKMRVLWRPTVEAGKDYFFYLYITYVAMQV